MSIPPIKPPPYTDAGNGERFATQHAGKVIHAAGDWWVYDGRRWKRDELNTVEQMAKATARSIGLERKKAETDEISKQISKQIRNWAVKSEANRALDSMLKRARSEPAIARNIADFDTDRFALNCKNGTVDLKTGTLAPHNPKDLITKLAPVAYDPAALCPQWLAFLDRIFAGSTPLIAYVQKLMGIACSGEADEQLMPIFWGKGKNGKSTLIETIQMILGDYADVAPDSLLVDTGRDEHPTQLAGLQGRRLVVASETEKDVKLKISLVKRLTGELIIKGRFMNKDYFTFPRTHHLIMLTNDKPRIPEDTEAAWRRLRLIPFTIIIPETERVKGLGTKLFREESAGILTWLTQGCMAWLRDGLETPPEVTVATDEYRSESDPLKAFLEDCCTVHAKYRCEKGAVRKEYIAFCGRQGDTKPVSSRFFNERMKAAGFIEWRGKVLGEVKRCWIGLVTNSGEGVERIPESLFPKEPPTDEGYQGEPE